MIYHFKTILKKLVFIWIVVYTAFALAQWSNSYYHMLLAQKATCSQTTLNVAETHSVSNEDNISTSVTIEISGAACHDILIGYRTEGDAVSGTHYTGLNQQGTILIPKGQTSALLNFNLLQNNLVESEKNLKIIFEGAQHEIDNVIVGNKYIHVRTIVDDDTTTYSAIQQMAMFSNGNGAGCSIDLSGRLKCWGVNTDSRLTGADYYVKNPTLLSTIVPQLLTIGKSTHCLISTDQKLYCWGNYGQSNFQTTLYEKDPGTNYIFADSGNLNTCAITSRPVKNPTI